MLPFETIIPYFVPVLFIIIASILGSIYYRSTKKASIEIGKKPLYTERCAGKVGKLYYKGPFIRVAIYDTFMVVSYLKQLVIHFDNIITVTEKKILLTKRLFITYRDKTETKTMYLVSYNPGKLKETLETAMKRQTPA